MKNITYLVPLFFLVVVSACTPASSNLATETSALFSDQSTEAVPAEELWKREMIARFDDWPEYQTEIEISQAPQGDWTAIMTLKYGLLYGGLDYYYARLDVVSANGLVVYTPIEVVQGFGLGYTRPAVLGWTADSGSVYYGMREVADGCAFWPGYFNVWAMDVDSGETWAQSMTLDRATPLSLSPDGRWIMMLEQSSNGETVLTLAQMEVGGWKTVPLEISEEVTVGSMVWKADSSALALTLIRMPCQPEQESTIMLVEDSGVEQRVLVDFGGRLLMGREWADENTLIVEEGMLREAVYRLDVERGTLTPVE